MLLVDDHQAQALELHVLLQQLVRADGDVDPASGEPFQRRCRFLAAPKARQLRELDRPIREAVAEGVEVLLGQERGGRKHRDLHVVCDRDEGGAERHFGLAEADVAADEAVHRLAVLHVLQGGRDRCRLVRRLLEAEALGEGLVIVLVQLERVALAGRAPGVEVEQLGGGVAHRARGLALRLLPLVPAQLVQRRMLGRPARVAADRVQLRHRHVELVLLRVLEEQEFRGAFAEVEVDQAPVAPDAVLHVHHRVARAQLGEIAQHAFDRGDRFPVARRARAGGSGVELRLGDEAQLFRIEEEAVQERRHAQRKPRFRAAEFLETPGRFRLQAVFGQVLRQRFAAAGRFGEQHHPGRRLREEGFQAVQGIGGAPLHRELGQRNSLRRFDVGPGEIVRPHEEILGAQENLRGRQQGPRPVALQELVAAVRVAPELGEGGVHLAVHADGGAFRQVVEDRRGLLEEKRQVVLDPGGRDAVAHVLVDAALRRIALEAVAVAAAEPVAPGLVHGKLARRQEPDLRDLVERALAVRIERADRLDFLIEQVEPVGQRAAHGKEVDQSAAHAVLARRDHLRDVAVAGEGELRAQAAELERFSRLEEEAVRGEEGRRREARERGRRGYDGDVEVLAHDAVERREALRHQIVVRREMIVGQGLPVGQEQPLELRREPRDLVLQPLRLGRLGAEDDGRPRGTRCARERERVAGAVEAGGARVLFDDCTHRFRFRNSKTRVKRRSSREAEFELGTRL